MYVKVSGGRIVIPKKIREMLRIKEGEEVFLEVRNKEIILKPSIEEEPVKKLYGSVRVEPEKSPKKVAREWMAKKIEESL